MGLCRVISGGYRDVGDRRDTSEGDQARACGAPMVAVSHTVAAEVRPLTAEGQPERPAAAAGHRR